MAVSEPPAGLIVFGAGSAAGAAIVEAYLRRTMRPVVAVSRRLPESTDNPGIRPVACEALDPAAVERVVDAEPDAAIVSVLGGKPGDQVLVDEVGNRNVIDAARAGQHVVLVTSLGCGETAELVPPRLREAIGPILDAKTAAEDHLRRSGLCFTIVRPGGLMTGAATGSAELIDTPTSSGMIMRADLAELIVDVIGDPTHKGRIYAAIDPELKPPPRPAG